MKFSKIGFGTPLREDVILYWNKSEHIERGILDFDSEGELTHYLSFDGGQLNDEPTHWMEIPKVENDQRH